MSKETKGSLLMASAALAWGFSYIFMKLGLESLSPFQIIFLRFGLAFPILIIIFRKRIRPNKKEVKYSLILGSLVFILSTFYNYGLKTTDASTAGFLAATTVVIVPILNGFIIRKFPGKRTCLATAISIVGVALISLSGQLSFSFGALLCIGGAATYAVQIIVANRAIEKNCDSLTIAIWQLGFAGAMGGIAMVSQGETAMTLNVTAWIAVLGLAFFSSAYGYIAQAVAQKSVPPERIGLIYASEPVFCSILAFIFFQELMTLREVFGAILILISTII
ncbi:MAG: DMT family transporter [Bacillota bacterium]|nr:DMT family transporter [Bacillota bacterium]